MELPLSKPHFSGALLLLLVSNLLLWEKASSIPKCLAEVDGCWNPLVETFNSAMKRAETLRTLADQFYIELYQNQFSSGQFLALTEAYLKTLINYVSAWINPLYHLVTELSVMKDVPEAIVSKVTEMEVNKRELLDDLKWILNKVYPTAEIKEEFPSWEHLSFLKSDGKHSKFLAMFNLSNCIYNETYHILFYLSTLKCRITGKDC
ncbi:prolactin-8A9-like isoform X3 [Apodemus sylvaticus]|uniref:prolactin-8A9-like isoform X3 n=1 Tax=Apodemus sylvaticus TaxID=10129 RepID=UPI002243778F|nr:prolactin-8A9-like isoform X3 [Apodemus sylvaticus]